MNTVSGLKATAALIDGAILGRATDRTYVKVRVVRANPSQATVRISITDADGNDLVLWDAAEVDVGDSISAPIVMRFT